VAALLLSVEMRVMGEILSKKKRSRKIVSKRLTGI